MSEPEKLVEVWRGPILECTHRGHAVICDAKGEIRAAWGDPDHVFLPRSASKPRSCSQSLRRGTER